SGFVGRSGLGHVLAWRSLAFADDLEGFIVLIVLARDANIFGGGIGRRRHVSRDVRRLALGALVVLQGVGKRGFGIARRPLLQILDLIIRKPLVGDFEIRIDARSLDRTAGWRVIARGR